MAAARLPAPTRAWGAGLRPRLMAAASVPASINLSSAFHHKKTYAHDVKLLSGTWVKDKSLSDPMGPALDLVQVNGVVRQAIKLVRGVKIEQTDQTWTMAVFSVIAWFKVVEAYALSGATGTYRRRDLRRGHHVSRLLPDHPGPHGGLMLALQWGAPHGGTGTDEFVLAPRGTAAAQAQARAAAPDVAAAAGVMSPDIKAVAKAASVAELQPADQELHVYSTLDVDGKHLEYRTVYHRKA